MTDEQDICSAFIEKDVRTSRLNTYMKKLLLVGTIAGTLSLVSCTSNEPDESNTAVQRCVDKENRVVDDSFCEANNQQPGSSDTGYGQTQPHGMPIFLYYHWFYGGPRSYVPVGSVVYGGSSVRPSSSYFVRPTSSISDPVIVRPSGVSVGRQSAFTSGGGTVRGVFGGAGEAAGGFGAGE